MDDGTRSALDPGALIEALPGRVAVQVGAEFEHVSDGFAEAIGEDADALRGRPWRDVFDRETICGVEAGVSKVRSGGVWRCTLELAESGCVELALSGTGDGPIAWTTDPSDVDPKGACDADRYETTFGGVDDGHPEAIPVSCGELDREITTADRPENALDRLTDRQREVLEAAFRAGYYDWPRGSTAEELADSLELTGPTLHGHLRKAERTVLAWLLGPDDGSR